MTIPPAHTAVNPAGFAAAKSCDSASNKIDRVPDRGQTAGTVHSRRILNLGKKSTACGSTRIPGGQSKDLYRHPRYRRGAADDPQPRKSAPLAKLGHQSGRSHIPAI